jgi:type II secretory pathway component PulJ
MNRKARKHAGLTLLELVVATLLASMALAAIVGVLGLLERQRKLTLPTGSESWRAGVVDLLERDLIGGRQIAFQDGRLTLVGLMLDDSNQTHSPFETTIELQPMKNQNAAWMIRTTRRIGVQNSASTHSLICGQVRRWEVERIDDRGVHQPLSKELSPAPRRLSLRIWFVTSRKEEYLEQWLFVAH